MKKSIILALLVVATITAFSQTTVISKALGDQIVLQKAARSVVTPVFYNGTNWVAQ